MNNKAFSNVHTIKKWKILPNKFSIKTEELTSTLKLKRQYITKKFKKIIDMFYI